MFAYYICFYMDEKQNYRINSEITAKLFLFAEQKSTNHCAPFSCACAECSLSIVVFHSRWSFQAMLASALGMTCFIAFLNIYAYMLRFNNGASSFARRHYLRYMEFFPDKINIRRLATFNSVVLLCE